MKGDDASRFNASRFASFRIASGTLRFLTQLKLAEARQLHIFAAFQRVTHHLKKGFNHLLRFAFVQRCSVAQHFNQFRHAKHRHLTGCFGSGDWAIAHYGAALRRRWGKTGLLQLPLLLSMI